MLLNNLLVNEESVQCTGKGICQVYIMPIDCTKKIPEY